MGAATRIVSIGPVTSATLREHGLEPDVEAVRHDIDGVVEAILSMPRPAADPPAETPRET